MPSESTRKGTERSANKIDDHVDRIRAAGGLRRQAEDRALVAIHGGLDADIEHDNSEREHCERALRQRKDDKGGRCEKAAYADRESGASAVSETACERSAGRAGCQRARALPSELDAAAKSR